MFQILIKKNHADRILADQNTLEQVPNNVVLFVSTTLLEYGILLLGSKLTASRQFRCRISTGRHRETEKYLLEKPRRSFIKGKRRFWKRTQRRNGAGRTQEWTSSIYRDPFRRLRVMIRRTVPKDGQWLRVFKSTFRSGFPEPPRGLSPARQHRIVHPQIQNRPTAWRSTQVKMDIINLHPALASRPFSSISPSKSAPTKLTNMDAY